MSKVVVEKPSPMELDYRTVFTTEAGERVLRDLMQRSFIWGTTFDHSEIAMAHNEGRRDTILYILGVMKKNLEKPTEYADEATHAEQDYTE